MMGFYHDIKLKYGVDTTKLMKQWASLNDRMARFTNRRTFLLRCRTSGIIPRHIHDGLKNIQTLLYAGNNTNLTKKVDNLTMKVYKQVLSMEIKITCANIKQMVLKIKEIRFKLLRTVLPEIVNEYEARLNHSFDNYLNKIKNRNIRKFHQLSQMKSRDGLFIDNSKWFKNLSDVNIPQDISDLLSLGPKFAVPCEEKSRLRLDRFLADVENIIEELPDNSKDLTRASTTNVITNFVQNSHVKQLSSIGRAYKMAKNFLKEHPQLLILQSDKGGCTVAMNKTEYHEKTRTLLQDEKTYKKLLRDPTLSLQNKFNRLIKQLKEKGEITEQLFKHLTIYNSSCPKLYCLPKVHKQNIPLRPIVSSVNSITYNASKFLAGVLETMYGDTDGINVKDTFSFVNNVQNMVLPQNFELVSLDVISLFTNIPLDLIVEILKNDWEDLKEHTTLSYESFFKLVDFVFKNTFFTFDNEYYLQIFGTPMGSPISPILAKVVLDRLISDVTPRLPFTFPFLYKYVDDIICAIPTDKKQVTLDTFNAFNTAIQFTMECETDHSVPFLDTMVIRQENGAIILDWYQKPTASGRFLNYYSNHPKNQKLNTVIAMKNRVSHICHEMFLRDNLKKLYNIFLNNGYPKYLLKKLIYNSNFFDGPTDDNNQQPLKYRKLPHINGLTDRIVSFFKDFPEIKIAKYNTLTNAHLFSKIKDKTPDLLKSNVIYELPCLGCEGVYIGQTSQWLKQRITQHKSDCGLGKNSCAVVHHQQTTGHKFDFDRVKILDREDKLKSRLFLEMYHIQKSNNSLNYKSDTHQLSNIYCRILDKI